MSGASPRARAGGQAPTHYDTLEVSPAASPETIRAAYRSLMQRFHPDRMPGDAAAAARAAEVAHAYDVLSDAARRAAYDATLTRAPLATPGARPPGRTAGRPARPSAGAGGWGAYTWIAVLVAGVGVGGWLATRSFGEPEPAARLQALQAAFHAEGVTEAVRRDLHAQKAQLLARHPALASREQAARQQAMAERGARLLTQPLVVLIEARGDAPAAELTVPAIQVQMGGFEAPQALAHLQRHRDRVVQELGERLARLEVPRLRTPAGAQVLGDAILGSVSASLGTDPAQPFPSTWLESPGRHGVVAVSLPERFVLTVRP
ncbi:DnaJ domain-containing protein [Ramlibacter sp.]|uniref:J domain-containing protein n=1 Tax=Ramlibacter sp. TaxID=1917967 RepID=UPI0035AFD540